MEQTENIIQPVTIQPETKTQSEIKPQPEVKIQPEVTSQPENKTQPEAAAQPKIAEQSKATAQPENKTQPEIKQQPEVKTQPEVTKQSEVVAKLEIEAQPEVIAKLEIKAQPEVKTQPEVTKQPEVIAKLENKSQPEVKIESEISKQPTATPPPEIKAQPQSAETCDPTKSITILLVEDNPGDVRLTQEVFKDGKICTNLIIVEDGEEAMEYLKKTGKYKDAIRPEIILLDLNLPKKDGRQVLAEIKADPAFKLIPVIVLTTSAAEQDILNTYANHANAYITKPVDFDQFMNVVRSIENFWLTIVKFPPSK